MTEDEKAKIEPDFNRAMDLWHDGQSLEAIEILKKQEIEFPNQPPIVKMIGAIYFSIEDWQNSLKYSLAAVKLSPESETFSLCLFHSLWNLECFDEAFEEAKRFIEQNGFSKEYDFLLNELKEPDVII